MNSNNGALYFDADIDNRKYLAKVVAMENRYDAFAQFIIKSNATIDSSFSKLTTSLNSGSFQNGLGGMQKESSTFRNNVLKDNKSIEDSYRNLGNNIGKSSFGNLGRIAVNGNNAAAKSFQELAHTATESGNQINSVFSGLTGVIAGFLSIQAAQGFVNEVIRIRTEFENLDVAFSTILKSKVKADELMADVIAFSATTPFNLTEVAKATKQLLAYGVAASDVKDELNTLANIAAGVSQPIGEVAYLYGTLKTQGRAYAMDIRQFTGRGIPVVAELAKVLGVAKDQVMGLVEEGKVGFPEVQKAFQNMTGAGGAFNDLMQKQSLTTGGRISNLKDQIDLMFNSFGKDNAGLINSGISGLQYMVKNYESVIGTIEILIATYGAYRAALAVTAAFNQMSLEATAAKIAALNGETAAEAQLAATKAAVTLQSAAYTGAKLTEAQASAVNSAALEILAAQENVAITRKAALSASSAFFTARQNLETAARTGASAAVLAEMRNEVALLAVKKTEAAQTAVNAAAELASVEARTLNSAATVRLTAMEGLRTIGLGIATKAQAVFNAVLLASPVLASVAAIVALGAVIYGLTQSNNTATEAQERFNAISQDAQIKREQEALKIKELIKIAQDRTLSVDQQAQAIKKLNALNPEFLGGINQANINTAEGSRLIKLYLDDLNNKALGELAYAEKMDNLRKIIELRSKGSAAMDFWEKVGSRFKAGFSSPKAFISSKVIEEEIVKDAITALENANKTIDSKYGKQVKDYQLKELNITDDAPKKSSIRNETFVKAEIKRLEDLRAGYALNSKEYRKYTNEIKALNEELANAQGKLTTAQKKDISERLMALNAIDKAERESKQKSLTDSEEKIQKAKDAAEELRKLARKAGLGSGVMKRIDVVEQTNTGNIEYETNTADLIKEVNRQKEIYKQYEQYKTTVSEDEANQRYKNEITRFSSFSDYLNANIEALSGGNLTGPERERLNKLLEIQKQYNIDSKEIENQKYADAYNAALSYNQEVIRLEYAYRESVKLLGDKATKEELDNLLLIRNKGIDSALETANKKTAIYQKLNQDVLQLTRDGAEAEIQVIEGILKNAKGIAPEVREALAQQLKYAKEVLALGGKSAYVAELKKQEAAINERISKEKLSNAELEEYKQKLIEIGVELKELGSVATISNKIASGLSQVGSAIGELSSSLEETNPKLAYTLGAFSELAAVGANAAGAVASFASGDIVGGVTKAIGAVAGLFSIGAKVKKMNAEARKEVEAFYEAVKKGEAEYQALLRERQRKLLEINAIGLGGIESQTNALKAQKQQINSNYNDILKKLQGDTKGQITGQTYKHGTWLRKAQTDFQYGSLAGMNYDALEALYTQGKLTEGAKKLFEELRKLKEEGQDVEAALKDAADAAAELATGTTIENLSSNIISSLRNGKSGLSDVMDDYNSIIREALLSSFKSEVVDVEMKAFYARLSALALSGGELTDDEIKQAQDDYIATRERIKKAFEDREKVTGTSLVDPTASAGSQSGISASIKSITSDEASAIEGFMRGIYDVVKRNSNTNTQNSITLSQQTAILIEQRSLQVEIRDNTAAIKDNTHGYLGQMETLLTKFDTLLKNTTPAKSGRDTP